MNGYHVAAIFQTYDAAERARRRLLNAGVGEDCIHLSHDSPHDEDEREPPGLWDRLFGPERGRDWYERNLTGDRTAVLVLVPEDHDHIRVAGQLVEAGALDLDDEENFPLRTRRSCFQGRKKPGWGESGSRGNSIPIFKEASESGKRQTGEPHRVPPHAVEHSARQDFCRAEY